MTNLQIKELARDWEIASHTFHHPNLPTLKISNHPDWQAQIVKSRVRLQEIIGKDVISFVYPDGAFDQDSIDLVAENYKIAVITGGESVLKRNELFMLPRQRIS